jgi:hypothetical protein
LLTLTRRCYVFFLALYEKGGGLCDVYMLSVQKNLSFEKHLKIGK